MKRMYLLVVLVAILGLLSFGCDTGNEDDDDGATTVLGETGALESNIQQLNAGTGEITDWTNPEDYVLVAGDDIEESSGNYVGVDDDGDGVISVTLDTPETAELYPITDVFDGLAPAAFSDSSVGAFATTFRGFTSLADYEAGNTEAPERVGRYRFPAGWTLSEGGVVTEYWYIYLSDAVEISGTATDTDNEDQSYTYPVSLSFQPGWNVYAESFDTSSETTTEMRSEAPSSGGWYTILFPE